MTIRVAGVSAAGTEGGKPGSATNLAGQKPNFPPARVGRDPEHQVPPRPSSPRGRTMPGAEAYTGTPKGWA